MEKGNPEILSIRTLAVKKLISSLTAIQTEKTIFEGQFNVDKLQNS